jgi:uncharacterized BrkB/YihY/UPF0761 family membrane protein
MDRIKELIGVADRWQRHNRFAGPAYGVVKKYGDDNAGTLVVALGWYGFTSIYPLLLAVVAVFGFVGESALGNGVVRELHQFPVIGSEFTPGSGGRSLHGSVFGLLVGVVGLVYGSLGVSNTGQQVMGRVWNVPQIDKPGFLPRLGRSVAGLAVIGGAFVVSAAASSLAAGAGHTWVMRVPVLAGLVAVNAGFYLAAFRVLTPTKVGARQLLPGSVAGGVAFTLLTTVGTSLVEHQLKHMTNTYGALASVIGVVAYLLLLAKASVYAAELNPVLARRLWPRALPTGSPTEADYRVLRDLVDEQRRRGDENVGVGFGEGTGEVSSRRSTTSHGPDHVQRLPPAGDLRR